MTNIKDVLCSEILRCRLIKFGKNLKNKSDSSSCIFNPRLLLSSVGLLDTVGKEIAALINRDKNIDAIVGISTSGIPWAVSVAMHSSKPFLYVRQEKLSYQEFVEGKFKKGANIVLVDDLIFHGKSISRCIEILNNYGIIVSHVFVLIDRQLERKCDGDKLAEKYNITFKALVNMQEIIEYLVENGSITEKQMNNLAADYLKFERHRLPDFARLSGDNKTLEAM